MVAEIKDGVDGWELLDYTWDPVTGIGRYEYGKTLEDNTFVGTITEKAQPYNPTHVGWYTGART